MKLQYGLLGILALLPAVSPLSARAEAAPQAVISEVNWAGSQASTADEWFELANRGETPLDLSGWSVNGITLPTNTIVSAHEVFLVANYGLGDLKTTLLTKAGLVTTAVSLGNSGMTLSLATPEGVIIDSYITGSKPATGSTVPFASAERDLTTLEWKTASTSANLSAAGQLGTPGVAVFPSAPEPVVEPPAPEPAPEPVAEPIREPVVVEAAPEIPVAIDPEPIIEALPAEPIQEIIPVEPVAVVEPPPIAPPEPEITVVAPISEPPAPEEPVSSPVYAVVITEFVSDPADGVEWIEVQNTTEAAIDLTGWTEKDGSTSKTLLPSQTLEPHAFFVIQNPKGKLNNDGDSIFLMDGTGKTIDAISYDKKTAPKKGTSLARFGDSWAETTPTPLALNHRATAIVDSPHPSYATTNDTPTARPNPETDPGTDPGTDNAPGTASPVRVERATPVETSVDLPLTPSLTGGGATPDVDASEVSDYADDTIVTVEGVLVAGPNVFGKQIAYVDGLEIYFNKADWPKLKPMTRVRVTGAVQAKDGYTRIKIKSRADIKVIGDDAIAPEALSSLDDAVYGLLMSASGSVTDVSKKTVTLELENGESIAVTPASGVALDLNKLIFGERIAVTGVTRLIKGAWVLTIVDANGLTVLQEGQTSLDEPARPSLGSATTTINTATPPPATKNIPWVGGGLFTSCLGALGFWFARAKGITLPSLS
jgi:hypothetical protein